MTATARYAVIYTDGGARPSHGVTGIGAHGYFYTPVLQKKGIGANGFTATPLGYRLEAAKIEKQQGEPNDDKEKVWRRSYTADVSQLTPPDVDTWGALQALFTEAQTPLAATETGLLPQVTVTSYVDLFLAGSREGTNNTAEITAVIETIRFAIAEKITVLVLRPDSTYVINAMRKTPQELAGVPNSELLLEMKALITTYCEHNTLFISWCKGHSLSPGNKQADQNATLGIINNQGDIALCRTQAQWLVSEAAKYWNPDRIETGLIDQPKWYFTSRQRELPKVGDYYVLTLGNHDSKEDAQVGKLLSTTSAAVIYTKTVDDIFNQVLARQHSRLIADFDRIVPRGHHSPQWDDYETLFYVRLDEIFPPKNTQLIKQSQGEALVFGTGNLNLSLMDQKPVSTHLHPPQLARRAFDHFIAMDERLQTIRNEGEQSKFFAFTDITDRFFETTVVKEKPVTRVVLPATTHHLDIPCHYYPTGQQDRTEGNVRVCVGLDLPARNLFGRIKDQQPTVTLVTWAETPIVIRYATYITCAEGYGLWESPFSNMRFKQT